MSYPLNLKSVTYLFAVEPEQAEVILDDILQTQLEFIKTETEQFFVENGYTLDAAKQITDSLANNDVDDVLINPAITNLVRSPILAERINAGIDKISKAIYTEARSKLDTARLAELDKYIAEYRQQREAFAADEEYDMEILKMLNKIRERAEADGFVWRDLMNEAMKQQSVTSSPAISLGGQLTGGQHPEAALPAPHVADAAHMLPAVGN